MTRGPALSCRWCSLRILGDRCDEAGERQLTSDQTPDWCPLRAQAIAALAPMPEPKAWAPRPTRIEGPPDGRPLVSIEDEDDDDA